MTDTSNVKKFKRGMYETEYGNVAFVSGAGAKTAYDIDMGERIPIELVRVSKFIRPAKTRRD
jgi:hypothetical protein